MGNRVVQDNPRLGGWITYLKCLLQVNCSQAPASSSFDKFKAMMGLLIMVFFVSIPFASAQPPANGAVLTNVAILTYDGLPLGRQFSVDFTVNSGGTGQPPTDITLQCQVEAGCTEVFAFENEPGQVLATVAVVDADQVVGHSLRVVGDSRFEIVGTTLKLVDGVSVDFELEQSATMAIEAIDATGSVFEKPLTIPFRNVNENPFELLIDNNYVAGDVAGDATGLKIGELTVSDVDEPDEHSFSVLNDDRFDIVDGNILSLAPEVSLGLDTEVEVTIIATDKGGLTTSSIFVITTTPPPVTPTPAVISFMAADQTGDSFDIVSPVCRPESASLAGITSLGSVSSYALGDPLIINVFDPDQNLQRFARDLVAVSVAVSTPGGDVEQVMLTESGVDTGTFVGYVYGTSQPGAISNCVLTVVPGNSVTATYIDPTDSQDVVNTLATISPIGLVFDDETGEPVSDVIITLINADDGSVAEVYGDGPMFAPYPASVKSGETIKDASGAEYINNPGEYRFPGITPGRYKIELFSSRGWEFSNRSDGELQTLAATFRGPYALGAGSRGLVIELSQGAIPRIDIPLHRVSRVEPEVVTPSEIEFLQYSANPSIGTPVDVGETLCVAGTASQVSELKNVPVPVPGVVNLIAADVFKAGQPIFVKVIDHDQNNDPDVKEKITIQLDVEASGDREFLSMTETGLNTGEFVGYIQSIENEATTGSCMLGVVKDNLVRTSYTDAFDAEDISDTLILVDPFGRLFSTRDGSLLDGVTVTLVDTATGAPAQVFGDGPLFADYPSSLVTGASVTDAAGLEYNFQQGEYRFPFVLPGLYRLEVSNLPAGYIFPSTTDVGVIQSLPGAPYQVVAGSGGGEFEVPVGPALHIDVPIDESMGEMFIVKQASKQSAAIGDFVQYRLNVQNDSESSVNRTQVQDSLPKGFRYQRGSLAIDGNKVADPNVAEDGRSLLISLPPVSDVSVEVSYVVEVTSGAEKGAAINTATVLGDLVLSSNVATATVIVTDDLFRDKAILVGKVFFQQCGEAKDGTEKGLAGVRLYLEDGRYVITDDKGFWHMEGIEPGGHLVQLDTDSLEERFEVSPCNESTRFAGSPSSQFVDVQGGTLWRADFAVQEKPAPESLIELIQTLRVDDEGIWISVKSSNKGPVEVTDVKAIYTVPKGWQIVSGSEVLDGTSTSHSNTIVGSVWNIGTIGQGRDLRFKIEPKVSDTEAPIEQQIQTAVLNPRFETRSAQLSAAGLLELDKLIATWSSSRWREIVVVGYTDNIPIAPHNRKEFADNVTLSEARAQKIADYISGKINVPISALGLGEQFPVSSNETEAGRKLNRRVDFILKPLRKKTTGPQVVNAEALNGESVVRLGFKSTGTPRGRTDSNRIPLNRLVGGFDMLSASVEAWAAGSWELVEIDENDVVITRDPSEQGLISVSDGDRLSRAIRAVKLDLDSRLKPRLTLDGVEIPAQRIGFKMQDETTGKTLYSYIGVDFGVPGAHELTLEGLDGFNNVRFSETANIVRVGDLFDIEVLSAEGNIADGRTPVSVKLLLTDRAGEPLNIAHKLILESDELHRYDQNFTLSDFSEIVDSDYVDVNRHGILRFNPVTHSGVYRATLIYAEFERDIEVFVEAEKRDWILVGLAEGTLAHKTLSGNMHSIEDAGINDEFDAEGRVAFYAKGQVKGEYVLTLAYDSAKDTRESLNQTIDPNTYYTLYGDQTSTQYDAASREKLFLKIERDQFYTLFGDFNTGLSVTELSAYSRSFTGLKTEYKGEKFELKAFVSETDQTFVKDEMRGDGTSGLYRLSSQDLVINSEKVTIETRDRFHTQDIINTLTLSRYIDYNINYETGTLFFKAPVYSQDTGFNPTYIVVDYEAAGDGDNKLNAGGRLAYKPLENMEIGLTVIKEGVSRNETELLGADFKYNVNEATEIRAEVAATRSEYDDTEISGSAYIVEATHRTSKIEAKGYIREQEGTFGLGQQNDTESGTRKIGVEATYSLMEGVEARAEAYRETQLGTGASQDMASTTVTVQGEKNTLSTGFKSAVSNGVGGELKSTLLNIVGNHRMMDGRLILNASADAPIGGQSAAADFPKRLRIGLDYKLTDSTILKAEQEFSWGDKVDSAKTRIGMNTSLWEGGELITNIEQADEENSQRLAAVAGLKQRFDLNEQWSFDFGLDSSRTLKSEKRPPPGLQVTTVFSGPDGDDFTSVTFGSKFRKDAWDWTTRVEYSVADSQDKINLISNVIHNLDKGQQLLAKVSIQQTESDRNDALSTDIQLGYSFRPESSRWSLFNRLDLSHIASQQSRLDLRSQKIVNNLNANYLLSDKTQIAFQYGLKYIIDNFDDDEYSGFTDLYGMEVRHDMGSKWDLGFQGSLYNSHRADVSNYSYGVSAGYSLAKNVWMSIGYNFSGFTDDDFSASEYTAEGVFLKYRFKFDQNTARGIADMMRN